MSTTRPSPSPGYEPQLTPRFVAEALHLDHVDKTPTPIPFREVTTDSRRVQPGSLFVAIKGDNHDGHDFIKAAIAAGATGVLCRKDSKLMLEDAKGVYLFTVDDTLAGFRRLAAAWRREFSIPIAVVAGSAGKTTTKEFLSAILAGRFGEVLKTKGSQNGFLGIPMTLLELRGRYKAAVVEVGIDAVGAMKEHLQLVNPSAAILTSVGPEHMENLIDIPTVAREEGVALAAVAQTGGTVAINLDDPWIRPHFTTLRQGRKLAYTLRAEVPQAPGLVRGELLPSGDRLRITAPEGVSSEKISLELAMPLLGAHNAMNLLGAVTVALGLGLSADEISRGLQGFQAAEGRSQVRKLKTGATVLCDYYNAQPPAVEAGLQLLSELASRATPRGARWVCLGDMLELGDREEQYHRDLAASIVRLGVEKVLLFGERMRWLQDELRVRQYANPVTHYASHDEMAAQVAQGVKPEDTVLIKGSRGMRMEEVWKALEQRVK